MTAFRHAASVQQMCIKWVRSLTIARLSGPGSFWLAGEGGEAEAVPVFSFPSPPFILLSFLLPLALASYFELSDNPDIKGERGSFLI